jgi:hypothetical protein
VTYDYEQKYPPDAPWHEIDEYARVWMVYNDEADVIDKDMIEEAGDILDILLIFVRVYLCQVLGQVSYLTIIGCSLLCGCDYVCG